MIVFQFRFFYHSYVVGSANINQRSMAGTRDTEMAVGCWQPAFPDDNPYGDVHIFRMSLWTEHFKISDPAFRYPGRCYLNLDLFSLSIFLYV